MRGGSRRSCLSGRPSPATASQPLRAARTHAGHDTMRLREAAVSGEAPTVGGQLTAPASVLIQQGGPVSKLRQRKSSRGRIECQVRRCSCQKIGRRLLMADKAEASLGGRTSVVGRSRFLVPFPRSSAGTDDYALASASGLGPCRQSLGTHSAAFVQTSSRSTSKPVCLDGPQLRWVSCQCAASRV